jgi:hypothetical protein
VIRKPTIIVTSLGRTGTKFFSSLFKDIVPSATPLHEPDVLHFFAKGYGFGRVLPQIQRSGIANLVIRKALGRWSLMELSDARVRGEIEYSVTVQRVLRQRSEFVDSQTGVVYIESNAGYYGLVDVLKDVYEHHRTAYIIRNGRDWVQSEMNWGQMYGKGRIRSLFAHTWPTASEIEGDPYGPDWESMSRFERICWAWVRLNEYALETIRENPHARVFRFEDIFESQDRTTHLEEMVRFVTALPRVEPVAMDSLDGWLDRRIHRSDARFPAWKEWTIEHKRQFQRICGPLLEDLGYELDV